MPDLSVCMIVKNEERYLEECLDSLKPLGAEIIVVDTGSTDRTREIALAHNALVFERQWNNNFSEARNYSLRKATGRWILYIDADERLKADSVPLLKSICSSDENAGVYCTLQSVDKSGGRPNIMKYIRLFHNHPKIQFSGRVHEQIYASLFRNGFSFVDSNVRLIHVGYDISAEQLAEKAERNLTLLLEDYQDKKEGYAAFQIASSFAIMKLKDKASEYFKFALNDEDLAPHYRAHANRFLAAIELEKGRTPEARQFINEAMKANEYAPLVNVIAGKVSFQESDIPTGFALFRRGYENNKALIEGRLVSPFDIMVDIPEMVLQGISYAVQYRNKEEFDFYLHEFASYAQNAGAKVKQEIAILHKLFENSRLSPSEISALTGLFSAQKSETYCSLIKNLADKGHALEIFNGVLKNYADIHTYAAMGQLYDETNKQIEALQSYAQALKLQPANLPVILHAVALLLRLNQVQESLALINASEELFKDDENQRRIIETVKKKISLLAQSIAMQN